MFQRTCVDEFSRWHSLHPWRDFVYQSTILFYDFPLCWSIVVAWHHPHWVQLMLLVLSPEMIDFHIDSKHFLVRKKIMRQHCFLKCTWAVCIVQLALSWRFRKAAFPPNCVTTCSACLSRRQFLNRLPWINMSIYLFFRFSFLIGLFFASSSLLQYKIGITIVKAWSQNLLPIWRCLCDLSERSPKRKQKSHARRQFGRRKNTHLTLANAYIQNNVYVCTLIHITQSR